MVMIVEPDPAGGWRAVNDDGAVLMTGFATNAAAWAWADARRESERPVADMLMDEVRAELRVWQARGLDGIPRTEPEADRLVELWARVDDDVRARSKSSSPRSTQK